MPVGKEVSKDRGKSDSEVKGNTEPIRRGSRTKKPNNLYASFWRHHDEDASDVDEGNV